MDQASSASSAHRRWFHDTSAETAMTHALLAQHLPRHDNHRLVEWDAYRYAPYKDTSGKAGVLLYAISHRAYGNRNAKTFLSDLRRFRQGPIAILAKSALPIPQER